MQGLNDRELITSLTAIVLPLLVALVQRPVWSSRTRALVGFVGILLWTLGGVIYLGDGVPQSVDWHAWVRLLMVNALVSWGTFQSFWKPTGIVATVEAVSSPGGTVAERGAKADLLSEADRKASPPRSIGRWHE